MNKEKDFDKTIRQVTPSLYRYCYSRLKNHEWADEALQLVMIILSQKWDGLEIGNNFEAYCIGIAKNCVKRVRHHHMRYYSKHESLDEIAENGVFSEASAIDVYFGEDDDQKNIERIADTLPDDSRQLFIYRFVEKKTLQEIQTLSGIPYSTLRIRLNRIEQQVRKEIKKYFN